MDGRTVLVTGAGRGIGLATADLFGSLGAKVAALDKDPAPSAPGGSRQSAALWRTVDARDHEEVSRFVEEVGDRLGPVDVLVNNAGGTFTSRFMDVTAKGEAMLVAENFTQLTHLVRIVVPDMAPGGSIINVTSIEAHQAAPGFAVYAAMKSAVENLTRSLALELAPQGIRVNAVAPDAIPTTGERGARQELLAGAIPFRPAFVPPLGHFGTPSDAAAAVLFLASDLARFVTGITLHVDGGTFAAGGWQFHSTDGDAGTAPEACS